MERLLATALGGIALSAAAAIAHALGVAPLWAVGGAIGAALAGIFLMVAWGSTDPSVGMFGPTLNRVDGAGPRVALTFDDGPVPGATEAILDSLAAASASATFFLLVDRAESHPELARRIARGHEVGLHGLRHDPWLTLRSPTAGAKELREARARLEAVIGRSVSLYRPPFGAVSPRLYESVRRAGLKLVWCSVRTRDGGPMAPETLRERFSTTASGDIVLLHEGPATTWELLPTLLQDLKNRGLRSVTVGALCASV